MLELDELLLLLLLDELLEELLDELLEELLDELLDELLEELPPPWTFFSSSGFSLRMISTFPVRRRLEEPLMGEAGRAACYGRACRRDDASPIPREHRSGVKHCRDPARHERRGVDLHRRDGGRHSSEWRLACLTSRLYLSYLAVPSTCGGRPRFLIAGR